MQYFCRALIALVLTSLSLSAWGQARQLLEQMNQALTNNTFKVSAIHAGGGGGINSFIYVHGLVDEKPVAIMEYLEGAPRTMVRIDQSVTYIEHNQPPYSFSQSFIPDWLPANIINKLDDIKQGYELVEAGKSRIAGRTAQGVRLVAKDEHRYSYWLWLDTETGLPLRFDMTSNEGLIERISVIELEVTAKTPKILTDITTQAWPKAMQAPPGKPSQWQFSWLPQGFKVITSDSHRLLGTNEPVDYVNISDGLVDISVYLSRASTAPLPEALNHHNGLAMATVRRGELEVVAVGKAPAQTLSRIAQSLSPN